MQLDESRKSFDMSTIMAAVLAGGFGTRLRSVVADRPKAMAEIHGRPFLAYLLSQLQAAGCVDVVLCTGHLGEQISDAFGERYGSLRLHYSRETQPLGTAGALRLAQAHLRSTPVLVMNGDSFCAVDLNAFCAWHHASPSKASMLLTKVADSGRYGGVHIESDGAVLNFNEKGRNVDCPWINAGVYLLEREVVLSIPEGTPMSLEYDLFPLLVGHGLYGYPTEGRFLDIGTPEDYRIAEAFFSR
jgi:D-glycero-alpha-D-manno-heptose 1-phosphate guanylyltransferase